MNPTHRGRRRGRGAAALALSLAAAVVLGGCQSDPAVDGVLWRQVASFEDPLSRQLYDPLGQNPTVNSPARYVAVLDGARWDGTVAAADELDLADGGVVLYDLSESASSAELSIFITSGPRPDVPTDEGRPYFGPSSVYTCYGVRTDFGVEFAAHRTDFEECPAALVALLPTDARFVVASAFNG